MKRLDGKTGDEIGRKGFRGLYRFSNCKICWFQGTKCDGV